MSDISIAILLAILFTIVLSLVQIATDSKVHNLRSYFTPLLLLYIVVMSVGNILTTLVASNFLDKYLVVKNPAPNNSLRLTGPIWLWYSIVGVFGFEVVIQKINVTIFDKGILSINDWITKAKTAAVAATLQKIVELDSFNKQQLADKIYEKYKQRNELHRIHTYATNTLGSEMYTKTVQSISDNSKITVELHLAYVLANENPTVARSILRSL